MPNGESRVLRTLPARPYSGQVALPPVWARTPVWPGPIPARVDAGAPNPWVWWLAAHGGAGVSTLTTLVPGSGDLRRAWPGDRSQSPLVVVVCRTHRTGLEAAQRIAAEYAGGLAPPHVVLAGVVMVADAPGRLPPAVRRLARLVGGAYARVWPVPWMKSWRDIPPDSTDLGPPVIGQMVVEIGAFADSQLKGASCIS